MYKFTQSRFESAWRESSASFNQTHCYSIFEKLSQLYTGQHRFYHGKNHIQECLDKMDQLESEPGHSGNVEIAIWFHDAIYEAGNSDNEQRSMEWFTDCACDHLNNESITEIQRLIMVTDHKNMPGSSTEKFMVDIDLLSFSTPLDKFMADGEKIRNEFYNVSDDDFIRDQIGFLTRLLDRSSIYSTEYFVKHHEKDARSNISHLLETYAQGEQPW